MMGFRVLLGEDAAATWPAISEPFAGYRHVFQARDFLETWQATIGAARGARLIETRVDVDDKPLMYVPFALERRRGARVLCFPDGGVCDYNAPLLLPAGARLSAPEMARVWKLLRAALPAFDIALFEKMPDVVAGAANPFRFLASGAPAAAGHAVTIDGDWRRFEAQRLHRAKDSRRKRRRLAELGAVRFVIAGDPESARAILDALMAQKSEHYLSTRGVDGLDRPGYRAYFRAMTERFAPTGQAHLSALTMDGEIVAAHWGLVTRERFYCLMLSHRRDGSAAKYSPGRLLIEDLMQWCAGQGVYAVDFGFGEAPWKDFLSDSQVPLRRAALARTPLGWAYGEAAGLRRAFAVKRPNARPDRAGRPAPSLS
jgi:CelD/BcsL family acetyltransferase involved in cellulose biosynthesis